MAKPGFKMLVACKVMAFAVNAAVVGAVAAQGASAPDDSVLMLRFTLPPSGGWGAVSIGLVPGGWHIGRADGPPATQAELLGVLTALAGLEIGGSCSGWVAARTSYPRGFAITDLDFAGSTPERFRATATDWPEPTLLGLNTTSRESAATSAAVEAMPTARHLVVVRAPRAYHGNKAQALSGTLRFNVRAVMNSVMPSEFDAQGGIVILRRGKATD